MVDLHSKNIVAEVHSDPMDINKTDIYIFNAFGVSGYIIFGVRETPRHTKKEVTYAQLSPYDMLPALCEIQRDLKAPLSFIKTLIEQLPANIFDKQFMNSVI
jgi:hypothetical protein